MTFGVNNTLRHHSPPSTRGGRHTATLFSPHVAEGGAAAESAFPPESAYSPPPPPPTLPLPHRLLSPNPASVAMRVDGVGCPTDVRYRS